MIPSMMSFVRATPAYARKNEPMISQMPQSAFSQLNHAVLVVGISTRMRAKSAMTMPRTMSLTRAVLLP
jgi:hypothetical protein